MPVHIQTKEFQAFGVIFRKAAKKAVVLTKRVLERGMEQVRGAVASGNFFDNPSGGLQAGTWAGEARVTGKFITVPGGWNSIVGPVREFGVLPKNQRGWLIQAKFAKALRFPGTVWSPAGRSGGSVGTPGIIYAKSVWHPWSDAQLRPHWGPTLAKLWPDIERQLDMIPLEALRSTS